MHYTREVRAVVVVHALAAAACLSTPPQAALIDAATDAAADVDAADPCIDGDGDGWPADLPGCGRHVDCADDDATRYPGALERDDGLADLDCNGETLDEAASVEDLAYSSLSGGGISVIARLIDLELGMAASYQLASLRTLNGANGELLFVGDMAEKWSGTNVWQSYFSTVAAGTPTTVTMGPAVFQWEAPFDSQGSLIGSSLYTITVDGRIHRSDTFTLSNDPAGAGNSVTSYVALDATKFVDVSWAGGGPLAIEMAPFTTYFEPFADAATWLCARTGEQDVVWANIGTSGPSSSSAGPRLTSSTGTWGEQVALQYDWQFNVDPVVTGSFAGHFLLALTYRNTTSPCGTGAAIARGYTNPAVADVRAPGFRVVDDAGDVGIADGYLERGGYYLVDAGIGPGVRIEIDAAGGRQPPVQSTWRVRGIPAVPAPVLERDGVRLVHGRDYRIQPDGTSGLWLVLFVTVGDNQVLSLVVPRQTDP